MMATMTVATRLTSVNERVAEAMARGHRQPGSVTVVGVSKTVDRRVVEEAYAAGLRHFGENRVQSAESKFAPPRPDDLTLHLIGHLQTNKCRTAVSLFDVIHSVDSERLVAALAAEARRANLVVPVLLEVNVSGELSKQGLAPAEVATVAVQVAAQPHLRLRGLMTMAPLVAEIEATRPIFRGLRELRDQLMEQHPGWELSELSMGMTNDFPVAIEEGATLVRIGRAIFGE